MPVERIGDPRLPTIIERLGQLITPKEASCVDFRSSWPYISILYSPTPLRPITSR